MATLIIKSGALSQSISPWTKTHSLAHFHFLYQPPGKGIGTNRILEIWQWIKYTPAELQQGVDLENLMGMSTTLFIVLNETVERTYANIESVLPYKSRHGDIEHFALKPSGEYTRVIHREGYKEPEEFAETMNDQ